MPPVSALMLMPTIWMHPCKLCLPLFLCFNKTLAKSQALVSFSLSFSFNVHVNSRLEDDWLPINEDETYTVLAGSFIASGKDGYIRMGEIADKIDLFKVDSETFISYCQENAVLSEPSADEYATQRFIAAGATGGESTESEAESGPEAETTDAKSSSNIASVFLSLVNFIILSTVFVDVF